jgi:putative transposase
MLLKGARHYHDLGRWWCELIVLMPDHLHAMLAFPRAQSMSITIGDWKRYQARTLGIGWQPNYFDHRIRDEADAKKTWDYIRANPVASGLANSADTWPWTWSAATDLPLCVSASHEGSDRTHGFEVTPRY